MFDKSNYRGDYPSELICKKILNNNGEVSIRLLNGKPCKIIATNDGKAFTSDKLNNCKLFLEFTVFDHIVELLKQSNKYCAPKGNAHGKGDKVGFGRCTEDTVVGTVAIKYFRKKYGDSTCDPTFVLAAVLEWAGIATNGRGFISLSRQYIDSL